ncbi:Cys-tRNA(Pro) deacylase [Shewanella sp. D64]|uniref:Cys-tRNA(Pro) deacylase n=1 Tax=unclassified Shewanella TaxID=196818 RepID=UPI0022BA4F15|nr:MULTISPECIES: Cys-tRNA(Pro) deacylase [unclassified Shewanella]MEC4727139.1 Cys-tRNA(Pro) deacylase [Shewanella sp. D64]MEC4739244.1 Cys-tRNA(Pro) deacylase [Shewanella sp. E94]WBJ95583.1 Cys-tRNA(Pro) deacylase [Shewanella sp. MTB7]
MTPAINALKKAKLAYQIHEYHHEANAGAYGIEAATKLNLDTALVFKTLVVKLDNEKLVVAIIPVAEMLNMKHLAKAAGVKKAAMASAQEVKRSTGYVLGGVSPLGQKRPLVTYIDISAQTLEQMYVSGGKRGLDIELAPASLQQLTKAHFVALTA